MEIPIKKISNYFLWDGRDAQTSLHPTKLDSLFVGVLYVICLLPLRSICLRATVPSFDRSRQEKRTLHTSHEAVYYAMLILSVYGDKRESKATSILWRKFAYF